MTHNTSCALNEFKKSPQISIHIKCKHNCNKHKETTKQTALSIFKVVSSTFWITKKQDFLFMSSALKKYSAVFVCECLGFINKVFAPVLPGLFLSDFTDLSCCFCTSSPDYISVTIIGLEGLRAPQGRFYSTVYMTTHLWPQSFCLTLVMQTTAQSTAAPLFCVIFCIPSSDTSQIREKTIIMRNRKETVLGPASTKTNTLCMNGFLHINHKEQTACARSIHCAPAMLFPPVPGQEISSKRYVFNADYEGLTSSNSIIKNCWLQNFMLLCK